MFGNCPPRSVRGKINFLERQHGRVHDWASLWSKKDVNGYFSVWKCMQLENSSIGLSVAGYFRVIGFYHWNFKEKWSKRYRVRLEIRYSGMDVGIWKGGNGSGKWSLVIGKGKMLKKKTNGSSARSRTIAEWNTTKQRILLVSCVFETGSRRW